MNSAVFVGMTRFELATSGPPDRCATGLRHIPSRQRLPLFRESGCKSTIIFAEKQLFSPKNVHEWHNYCFLQSVE